MFAVRIFSFIFCIQNWDFVVKTMYYLNVGQHIFYIYSLSFRVLPFYCISVLPQRDLECAAETLEGLLVVAIRCDHQRMKQQIKVNKIVLQNQVTLHVLTKLLGGERRKTAGLCELSLSKSSYGRIQPLSPPLPMTSSQLPSSHLQPLFHIHVFR